MSEPIITKIKSLEIPENAFRNDEGINPFHYDSYHMGQNFSKSVMLMFANHQTEKGKYLLLVNKRTGERMRIDFPENWQ